MTNQETNTRFISQIKDLIHYSKLKTIWMFIRTTAINKIKKLNKFVKGIQGGSSAGKTFAIIPIEIDYAIKNPFTEISIVSESVPHLKRGAIKDF